LEFDFYNIIGPAKKVAVDYDVMPHAIFTSPQIAGVGKTEEQLKAAGREYSVGRYDYIDTAMRRGDRGRCRLREDPGRQEHGQDSRMPHHGDRRLHPDPRGTWLR
jgi:pyruvate/2-oxoglutarate dehydrogenase complex dihydrolipoamide dehydrogenase (E3) component